ncbi:MAG: hypothetical protein JNK11_06120 [Alphaproteobacteria bacterium]|nr:hypothetical protein [Alphaproteobacteria bacterium]
MIAGLVAGGVVAAPLAATVASRLPGRWLMVAVGLVVLGLSLRGLWQSLAAPS